MNNLLTQGLTLTWRGLVPMRNSPGQIIGLFMQPLIMIVVFVYLFGGANNDGDRAGVVLYSLPGVLAQVTLMGTGRTGMMLHTDLTNGVFDRLRGLPVSRAAPLLGRVLADTVALSISALAALSMGFVVGFRVTTGPAQVALALLVLLGFATCVACVSAWVGLIVENPAGIQVLITAVMLPLTMGSNAYMRPEFAPGWMRGWLEINPVSHLVSVTRGLLLGGDQAAGLGGHLLVTAIWGVGIVAVAAPLAIGAYKRRI